MRRRRLLAVLAATGIAAGSGAMVAGTPAVAAGPTVRVIATGLNNPRGLAFAPDGRLYVAEAGRAGNQCFSSPEGEQCAGRTGSVSQIHLGVHRFVTGLISVGGKDGTFAIGADGLSISPDGGIYTIMGGSTKQIPPHGLSSGVVQAAKSQLGRVVKVGTDGGRRAIGNVGDYDYAWTSRRTYLNPDFPDANPYGILSLPGGHYVVDAGANTLDLVKPDGTVRVLTLFPDPKSKDSVPTCVVRGPDRALYVGELTGGGNPPGSARVWRVVPGHAPTLWAAGFTTITGCAFDKQGNFYVTEMFVKGLDSNDPAGDVVKLATNHTRTHLGVGKLFMPQGLAIGPQGELYVSNWSTMPGVNPGGPTGQVVRIG